MRMTMLLYRPMDIEELRLVYEGGMRGFPPRKPEQPFFYPVLNQEYADEIASSWNASGSSGSGYVARFKVEEMYCASFEPHKVGGAHHLELWVPAGELARFNDHIEGSIEIVSAHFGKHFRGYVPDQCGLKGKDAAEQIVALNNTIDHSIMDVQCEIATNHTAIFLHYPYWRITDFSGRGISDGRKRALLTRIEVIWSQLFPLVVLPGSTP
jgi:hypothetical protein